MMDQNIECNAKKKKKNGFRQALNNNLNRSGDAKHNENVFK